MEPTTDSRRFSPQFEQVIHGYMCRGKFSTEEEMFAVALESLDIVWRQHAELKSEIQRRVAEADTGNASPLNFDRFLIECRQHRQAAAG